MSALRLAALAVILGASPAILAAEIQLRADRDQLKLGESVQVTITVRGASQKPVVLPPTVPYCRIEQIEEKSGSSRPAPAAGVRPPPIGGPAGAIGDLERTIQGLTDQMGKQGFGDSFLLREYDGMLRDIRQQALEALNNRPATPGQRRNEFVFRVTPERSGTLQLSPFSVRVGSVAHLTKSLTLTIGPAATSGDAAVNHKPEAPAAAPLPFNLPARGLQLAAWQWGAVLFLTPLLGAVYFLLRSRKSRPAECRVAPTQSLDWRREALRRLAGATTAAETAAGLVTYVRARCHLPPGEITPTEAAAALRRVDVDATLAERTAEILDRCASARYAPQPVAVFELELTHAGRQLACELERRS
jgi:hypothetical protein